MSSASKCHDAVGVLQSEHPAQLIQGHPSFQAVPDARLTQAGCGEYLWKSKDSTTASEFVIEDGGIEAPASTRHENEVFGSTGYHPVEMSVDDRLGFSRKIDLAPFRHARPATGKADDHQPVQSFDVGNLKQRDLGWKAAGAVKQGQCRVELDSLGLLRIERDQSQAIGGSWKSGHASDDLISSYAPRGRPSDGSAWADVAEHRRLANHPPALPDRHGRRRKPSDPPESDSAQLTARRTRAFPAVVVLHPEICTAERPEHSSRIR
jgi:hypothetical protein